MRYSRTVKNPTPTNRHYNWDVKLVEFIRSKRKEPFTWGANDCLTFANNAVIAMRGEGFTDNHLGEYKTVRGALGAYNRWLEASGCATIVEGLDQQFERIGGLPPRGSIVAMPVSDGAVFPYSIGVMVSQYAAFVGENGLIMVVPDETFLAWRTN